MECTNYSAPHIQRGIIKKATLILSLFSIAAVIAADLFLPQLVDYYQDLTDSVLGIVYVDFLWLSSIPLIILLVQCVSISCSLNSKSVFSPSVLRKISIIQLCLLLEAAFYIHASITFRTMVTAVILFAVIMLLVLATLFKEVIRDGLEYYNDSNLAV